MSRWSLAPVLLVVWLLLWGEASVGNIVGGAIVISRLLWLLTARTLDADTDRISRGA